MRIILKYKHFLMVFLLWNSCVYASDIDANKTIGNSIIKKHQQYVKKLNTFSAKDDYCKFIFSNLHPNTRELFSHMAKRIEFAKLVNGKLADYKGKDDVVELSEFLWPFLKNAPFLNESNEALFKNYCIDLSSNPVNTKLKSEFKPNYAVHFASDRKVVLKTHHAVGNLYITWIKANGIWTLYNTRIALINAKKLSSNEKKFLDSVISIGKLNEKLNAKCFHLKKPIFGIKESKLILRYFLDDSADAFYRQEDASINNFVSQGYKKMTAMLKNKMTCGSSAAKATGIMTGLKNNEAFKILNTEQNFIFQF